MLLNSVLIRFNIVINSVLFLNQISLIDMNDCVSGLRNKD